MEILPNGVTRRKVFAMFLAHPNIKALIGKDFDENDTVNNNSIRFLEKMEAEGKLGELYKKMV